MLNPSGRTFGSTIKLFPEFDHLLTTSTLITLVEVTIISHLDFPIASLSSLYNYPYPLGLFTQQPPWGFKHMSDNVTLQLKIFYCPISFRVKAKIIAQAYKVQHDFAVFLFFPPLYTNYTSYTLVLFPSTWHLSPFNIPYNLLFHFVSFHWSVCFTEKGIFVFSCGVFSTAKHTVSIQSTFVIVMNDWREMGRRGF